MKRLFLILLFPAVTGIGETFPFSPSPDQIKYRLAHTQLSLLFQHPFKAVRFELKNLHGTLLFSMQHPEQGLKLDLEMKLSDLDSGNGYIQTALYNMLGPGETKIQITAEGFQVLMFPRKPEDPLMAAILPLIRLGDTRSANPRVEFNCVVDGKILHCDLKGVVDFLDFGIPPPRKWGVPAQNKMELTGEVGFTPEEAG